MNILSGNKPDIPSDSEYEPPTKEERALQNLPWNNTDTKSKEEDADSTSRNALYDENSLNEMKNYLETDHENSISNIYDIPGKYILLNNYICQLILTYK